MKRSTILFILAAVVTLVGVFFAASDLLKHKATSSGNPTATPEATATPADALVVTTAPPTVAPDLST